MRFTEELPQFQSIDISAFATRLDALLADHLQRIDRLTKQSHPSWASLMYPLEEMSDELERFWSPFSHIHAVVNTPELRACYNACLPKLSAYESAIGQNQALYDAVKRLDIHTLNAVQRKIVDDYLLDFVLAGVSLPTEAKKRFEAIQTQLSSLSNRFENHVLDAVQDYYYPVQDPKRLAGLPAYTINGAAQLAQEKKIEGWAIGLDQPSFTAVVTYADDRSLRQALYEAYVTRASDQGPSAGRFDNTQLMREILALRCEAARLLGYANYAEFSLATKMAESTQRVTLFLHDMVLRSHQQAKEEFSDLQAWAHETLHLETLEPWDIAYASEKRKEALYSISQEVLRPYFPLPKVLSGLFAIVQQLYGMSFSEISEIDRWNPDVQCYQITDETGTVRGVIYLDLFARTHKRGGAWMDSCQSRWMKADGRVQLPIATLTCNFAQSDKIPCLSHDELTTLFHEFGHCLHHVLTQVDYISASGIHGVEWDAVELPSQFFENWCWDQQAIQQLSAHIDTQEPLPIEIFQQLIAAKNFQSAMVIARQLEFAQFDFRIHTVFREQSNVDLITQVLNEVRKATSVVPIAAFNRFQHSFTHVFSGGYAAGYYSYLWAELLSSDAFSRFEEEGVFNAKTGRYFLQNILEVGGSKKALEAFVAFRGREPTIDALLRHNGIQDHPVMHMISD